MQLIIIFALILVVGYTIYLLISAYLTKKRIANAFRTCNTITFGKQGNGKDLLMQAIIETRKEPYFANMSYGYNYKGEMWPRDFALDPNTYVNLINNKVVTLQKHDEWEGVDYYMSDAGIILPAQMDSVLHKQFTSFPIFYALSRQLYHMHIHMNTQSLERPWKAIREQADYFVKCRGVISIPFFLIIKTTEYDRYQSALNDVRAYHGGGWLNKFNKAERAVYEASNGFIQDGFIMIKKKSIKYDTRAYHKKLFGKEAPKRERARLSHKNKPVETEEN